MDNLAKQPNISEQSAIDIIHNPDIHESTIGEIVRQPSLDKSFCTKYIKRHDKLNTYSMKTLKERFPEINRFV